MEQFGLDDDDYKPEFYSSELLEDGALKVRVKRHDVGGGKKSRQQKTTKEAASRTHGLERRLIEQKQALQSEIEQIKLKQKISLLSRELEGLQVQHGGTSTRTRDTADSAGKFPRDLAAPCYTPEETRRKDISMPDLRRMARQEAELCSALRSEQDMHVTPDAWLNAGRDAGLSEFTHTGERGYGGSRLETDFPDTSSGYCTEDIELPMTGTTVPIPLEESTLQKQTHPYTDTQPKTVSSK